MNWLLTWIMLATVLMLLSWGMLKPERIYQFPFLIGVITFAFILPQVPALADDRFLPEGGYAKTIAFTILCLSMCWLGFSPNAKPFAFFRWDFDEKRLLIASFFLSLMGAYFYYKLSRLPGEMTVGVQMSGAPVAWLFFARFMSYGMAIAILCFARRFSWTAAFIIGADLIFYFDRIVVTGKRAEAVELMIMFALAFWFYRGWVVPRTIMLGTVLAGTLLMNSMGDYRTITRANSAPVWQDIAQINVAANFDDLLKNGGPEMRNAIWRMHHTEQTLDFDYGKFHWNRLVFNYVPAQLVGADFKTSLMMEMPVAARDYDPLTGTTETGMADAFQSFWYFGALKFLFLAYVMSRLWASAKSGEMSAQLVYIFSIVPAIHAISHQTDWVLTVWVHMLIFLLPTLAWCLSRSPRLHPHYSTRIERSVRFEAAASR